MLTRVKRSKHRPWVRPSLLLSLSLVVPGFSVGRAEGLASSLDPWLDEEAAKAAIAIGANITPNGTVPGFVAASPSKTEPNYFFHWTRDAALTMNVVLDLARGTTDVDLRSRYLHQLRSFVNFTRQTQQVDTLSGRVADHFANIGEPKFNPDGTPFTGEWGRPQADGPALRVITLLHLLEFLQSEPSQVATSFGSAAAVREFKLQIHSAVRADLEYIVYHGLTSTFDLWEETQGHHFYTEMVQRRAVLLGAEEAFAQSDYKHARLYRLVGQRLDQRLVRHWDKKRGYLVETLGRTGGVDYKTSNLDAGVVLAALHAASPDATFGPSDDRILATAEHLRRAFKAKYAINTLTQDDDGRQLEVACGRYTEDRYDGSSNVGGNPWVLITLGMAELDYRVRHALHDARMAKITRRNLAFFRGLTGRNLDLKAGERLYAGTAKFNALLLNLRNDGDAYFARVHYHMPANGELSEQIQRSRGTMTSAADLSWSYASFLTAVAQR